jgi:hypothetical protein
MKTRRFALTTVVFAAAVGLSLSAVAANTTQTIKQVELRVSTSTPDLLLQTNDGVNYQGTATYSQGCGIVAPTADAVKIWASLGQAALLSGKNVTIYYTNCGGTNWIQDVVLVR